MPILSEQPSLYPEELFREGGCEGEGRRWWVLYTKVRQEKALARHFWRIQIPFYLPLVWKRTIHPGRVVRSQIPLFPGYVFLWGTEEERAAGLSSNRIVRTLAVPAPERLRAELCHLQRLIGSGVAVTLERHLEPGARVRVGCGPLAGLEGTVLIRRGATRLLVAVDFLQQGASMEIEEAVLERWE